MQLNQCNDQELQEYILRFYGEYMSKFELEVNMSFLMEERVAHLQPDSPYRIDFLQAWCNERDPEIGREMIQGAIAFRAKVISRILRDHGVKIFLNRCVACNRLLKTPRAKQCLSCGRSWHKEASAT
jgi:hypothetical protein